MPAHRAPVARGERLDPFGGDVRIRRREVEIEIDGGEGSSRQRTATSSGSRPLRPRGSRAQLGGEIDEVARDPVEALARRCSRARHPARARAAARRTPSAGRRAAPRRGRSGGRRPSAVRRGAMPSRSSRAAGTHAGDGLVDARNSSADSTQSHGSLRVASPCRRAARRCRSRASRSRSAPSAAVRPSRPRRARDRGGARRGSGARRSASLELGRGRSAAADRRRGCRDAARRA